MKKFTLVIFVALILGTGVYWWLQNLKKTITDPWQIISSKTVCVIESRRFDKVIEQIGGQNGLFTMSTELADRVLALKTKDPLFLACFATSNESVEGIFVIKYDGREMGSLLRKAKEEIKTRTFSGFSITEICNGKKVVLSFSIIDKLLVIGPSLLIEDAIRALASDQLFRSTHSPLFQLQMSAYDDGNIYINTGELFDSKSKDFNLLKTFSKAAVTDVNVDNKQLFFTGFSFDSIASRSLLSLWGDQQPGPFGMKEVITSQSTVVVHHYLSDPLAWFAGRKRWINQYLPSISGSMKDAEIKYQVKYSDLQKSIGNELALCYQPTDSDTADVVFVVKTKNDEFNKAMIKVNAAQSDPERLGNYVITEIAAPFFVRDLFWPAVPNRAMAFYATSDHYLFFSSNREALKDFLVELNADNTLGKSLDWNKFISSTIQESTLSAYFTGTGLSQLMLGTRVSSLFDFSRIDKGSLQLGGLENGFSHNAIFQLNEIVEKSEAKSTSHYIGFKQSLVRSPEVVVNHNDKSSELLLQDTLNQISLLSGKDKVLWSLNTSSPIRGAVSQIDFYKNRKLQYFFTTKDQLNLVDRLGREVKGFPVTLGKSDISFSRVVDYDRNRDYRFMIVEKNGTVRILDKEGKGLEGWNPKSFPREVVEAGQYRIASKDYFLVVQEDGVVSLFNRKSEMVNKFPVRLSARIAHCFYTRDKQGDSGIFSFVSDDGMLFTLNTSGEITKKEPLLKNTVKSSFQEVDSDKKGVNWIARIEKTKIAIFDQEGKQLFERENPASEKLYFNYFHSDKPVFSLFDPAQELVILLDKNGREIIPPLEATQTPVIEFLPNGKKKLYYVFHKQLHFRTLTF